MISILTPAYIDSIQRLEWLNDMIKSIREQAIQNWEIILMDDASPLSISLDEPDERIRIFRMAARSGPALCRNTAVALARYEALLPVDSDDLLPIPNALNTFHSMWQADPSKIVYGHIQRLIKLDGLWRKDEIIELPEYSFFKAMDFKGIIPVTAMHSKECHYKAGGWKAELDAGLEDVEYWIAAGKAGFCGQKVDELTLIYRRHDESRSAHLRRVNKRETEMRNRIRNLHADVYEGRFPMGCCGGGKPYVPPVTNQASMVSAPSTLDQYSPDLKVWVEYAGQREASFGMVGPFTNISYIVDGPGHKLEVHVNDLPKFRRSGRGMDFRIGVGAPNGHQRVEVAKTEPQYVASEPQLATILQLDEVALGR